ncbi:Transposase [Candidatus Paraburkholderia calva]|nr:Transposase [Candidatus Paraburkholderia calva]
MPGLEFRYVGQDRLPTRLSEFNVERYFALTDDDIAVIGERFRRDRRAGAAIQLVFLRASGHTLDHVGTLQRQLLRYIGERLGQPTPTMPHCARFISITRHNISIRSGRVNILSCADQTGQLDGLEAWMRQDAVESLALDELVQHAYCWLYERRILIPAERTVRDFARSIWLEAERRASDLVRRAAFVLWRPVDTGWSYSIRPDSRSRCLT